MSRAESTPAQQALFCQRWRERREYRIPGRGVIRPDRYRVDLIVQTEAKRFVIHNHYSGSFPAARLSVGLFCASSVRRLLGVAVFGVTAIECMVARFPTGAAGYQCFFNSFCSARINPDRGVVCLTR